LNITKSELINIIGIGTFTYLSISGFSILVEKIIRELFIIIKTDNSLNFWTTEIVDLALFTFISFFTVKFIIRIILKSKFKLRKIFISLFIGLFVIQVFQFLYAYYGTEYVMENYHERFVDFYEYLSGRPMLSFYSSIIATCKYLFFGIIILIGNKTVANNV